MSVNYEPQVFLFLSELLGRKIVDSEGRPIGKVLDLTGNIAEIYPPVTDILVRLEKDKRDRSASLAEHGGGQRNADRPTPPAGGFPGTGAPFRRTPPEGYPAGQAGRGYGRGEDPAGQRPAVSHGEQDSLPGPCGCRLPRSSAARRAGEADRVSPPQTLRLHHDGSADFLEVCPARSPRRICCG